MMTVKELKKALENLPDDAIVYIQADHGQQPEQANYINTTTDSELDYYGDDIEWNEEEIDINATAIMIS